MNHPAGPFVCPYCSASRKRAHESARGYFTRCSHVLNQIYGCVRVPVCETERETEIVGCICVAATFVALPFIFYGLKQIVLH